MEERGQGAAQIWANIMKCLRAPGDCAVKSQGLAWEEGYGGSSVARAPVKYVGIKEQGVRGRHLLQVGKGWGKPDAASYRIGK